MATKSSRQWLREHFSDPYVKQAKSAGYRSRAVFKLLEIDKRDHLFKPGMKIVDLGAAPGGWSQVAVQAIKGQGHVIAVDILGMEPIDGVTFLQGDFSQDELIQRLHEEIGEKQADLVLSDMAPNMSGNESIDIPRAMYLAELALEFAVKSLKPQGSFLIKAFQGEGFDTFLAEIRNNFKKVVIRKPKASRGRSREVYILARELKTA